MFSIVINSKIKPYTCARRIIPVAVIIYSVKYKNFTADSFKYIQQVSFREEIIEYIYNINTQICFFHLNLFHS